MTVTVTGQKHDFLTADPAKSERTGRFAKRRPDNLAACHFEVGQLRQATAANYCKHVKFLENFAKFYHGNRGVMLECAPF